MKRLLTTLFTVCCALSVFAQFSGDNTRTLGDRTFRNKDYYEAAYYYKKAATGMNLIGTRAIPYQATKKGQKKAKHKDHAYISYQLAESLRLYENYIEAEGWYKWVLDEGFEDDYPLSRLWHGICLRAIQKFDDAIKQLQKFTSTYKGDSKYIDIANKEIANCRFAKEQYQYPVLVDVNKKAGEWNSDGSDYAVVKQNNNYWFTSSRLAKDDKKNLNRIYLAAGPDAKPVMIDLKNTENIKELEFGTASFDPSGNRMYFTRWYKDGNKYIRAIYLALRNGQDWGTPQKLGSHVNAEGYSAIQPFVSDGGKKLYFVSNKPGGQGGDDIWVSELGTDGLPINAVNLGNTINTPFDEQAPYYNEKQKRLIYSSKGFIGLGGFDFFESHTTSGRWTIPVNMGYPVNSAKDDLYYSPIDDQGDSFYISSDRESDCCLNIFEGVDRRHMLAGLVTDCDTKRPLAGVKVSFIDSLSNQILDDTVTTAKANYAFTVNTRRPYNLKLEKKGYFTKVLPVPQAGTMRNDTLFNADICLQAFEVEKPIVIENVLYDFDKATLRPESKTVLDGLVTVMRDNPRIRVELAAHTDSKGTDNYNMQLSQARAKSCVDYIISRGISSSRIYARGYGESRPVALNTLPNGKDNPDGRQLNRRTEFKVVKIDNETPQ